MAEFHAADSLLPHIVKQKYLQASTTRYFEKFLIGMISCYAFCESKGRQKGQVQEELSRMVPG